MWPELYENGPPAVDIVAVSRRPSAIINSVASFVPSAAGTATAASTDRLRVFARAVRQSDVGRSLRVTSAADALCADTPDGNVVRTIILLLSTTFIAVPPATMPGRYAVPPTP